MVEVCNPEYAFSVTSFSVIDHYLLNELEKGCIPGPYSISPLPSLHVSRFGVIPKKDQPGKTFTCYARSGEAIISLIISSLWISLCPVIFSSIADLLEWILEHNYNVDFLLQYLDDFYTWVPPTRLSARTTWIYASGFLSTGLFPFTQINWMGPPLECLTVIGIELDSLALQATLPQDKFERIVALLDTWSSKQH